MARHRIDDREQRHEAEQRPRQEIEPVRQVVLDADAENVPVFFHAKPRLPDEILAPDGAWLKSYFDGFCLVSGMLALLKMGNLIACRHRVITVNVVQLKS